MQQEFFASEDFAFLARGGWRGSSAPGGASRRGSVSSSASDGSGGGWDSGSAAGGPRGGGPAAGASAASGAALPGDSTASTRRWSLKGTFSGLNPFARKQRGRGAASADVQSVIDHHRRRVETSGSGGPTTKRRGLPGEFWIGSKSSLASEESMASEFLAHLGAQPGLDEQVDFSEEHEFALAAAREELLLGESLQNGSTGIGFSGAGLMVLGGGAPTAPLGALRRSRMLVCGGTVGVQESVFPQIGCVAPEFFLKESAHFLR